MMAHISTHPAPIVLVYADTPYRRTFLENVEDRRVLAKKRHNVAYLSKKERRWIMVT